MIAFFKARYVFLVCDFLYYMTDSFKFVIGGGFQFTFRSVSDTYPDRDNSLIPKMSVSHRTEREVKRPPQSWPLHHLYHEHFRYNYVFIAELFLFCTISSILFTNQACIFSWESFIFLFVIDILACGC